MRWRFWGMGEGGVLGGDADLHRFGTVALCGPPNVGKSTLLNHIVGRKISISSRRPQTTRHRILGIKTLPGAQLVFVDTPGLNDLTGRGAQRNALGRAIQRTAVAAATGADILLFMLDYRGWNAERERLFAQVVSGLGDGDGVVMLLLNKVDRLRGRERERLLPLIEYAAGVYPFREIIPLSARKPRDVARLVEVLRGALPVGEAGFAADMVTDRDARFLAAELVREQTFRLLGQELPYASAVEVVGFEGGEALQVEAVVWVERESQKGILIGRGGQMLGRIAEGARREMGRVFGVSAVELDLRVKVRKGWANDMAMVGGLGYAEGAEGGKG